MTSKQHALVGNILTTISFLITAYTTLSFNLDSADAVVSSAFTVGVFIGLGFNLILHVLTWIAYVMIGKTSDKGWKIFLLVIGIIWIVGAIFAIFLATVMLVVISVNGDDLMSVAVVKFLGEVLQLAGGIFFIIAFALKPKTATISNG